MSDADDDRLVPIARAGKAVGLGRAKARDLAIRSGIAIRRGGNDDAPWLVCSVADLMRAYRQQRYNPRPHGGEQRKYQRKPHATVAGGTLNPLVRC